MILKVRTIISQNNFTFSYFLMCDKNQLAKIVITIYRVEHYFENMDWLK